ncbi:substrate-binding domain-containing protein [Lentzea sp. BCCO 10_0798]|uniref:Substrate-binding domain-containing protein n=1 Tax=Lentzea kristufekii TaxID=3095430 RepID=A0ABU4U3D0_9PSEU|nr:substrate-binding domain-containing protein [Lentzea sp. BCCO 10_0798]MDX8055086.1 substrate-binding domain-containing protein [Lentzea sp. BCCO 10_0798]
MRRPRLHHGRQADGGSPGRSRAPFDRADRVAPLRVRPRHQLRRPAAGGVQERDLQAEPVRVGALVRPGYASVAACLDDVLRPDRGTTGLVVHNEAILGQLLLELRRRSLDVPADLSVITLCPDDLAENLAVPLTSMPVPAEELGAIAVEMVMARLAQEQAPEVRLLQPRLTDRGSTATR